MLGVLSNRYSGLTARTNSCLTWTNLSYRPQRCSRLARAARSWIAFVGRQDKIVLVWSRLVERKQALKNSLQCRPGPNRRVGLRYATSLSAGARSVSEAETRVVPQDEFLATDELVRCPLQTVPGVACGRQCRRARPRGFLAAVARRAVHSALPANGHQAALCGISLCSLPSVRSARSGALRARRARGAEHRPYPHPGG